MFVPGVMTIILMLLSAMMTSVSITREKETGTMELLLVSPLSAFQVIAGKVVPYVILALLDATMILVLAKFVFHMPFVGSLWFLGFETLLFVITALALGIFISSVAPTQQAALMASLMGLMLPTIMLSGFVFPIRSMAWPLRLLSNVVPARWFIEILRGILLKGSTIVELWQQTLVLATIAAVLLLLSVRRYSERLE